MFFTSIISFDKENAKDEEKAFITYAESKIPTLDLWKRVYKRKGNVESLADEMEVTKEEVEKFMEDFEAEHRARLFRRESEGLIKRGSAQQKEEDFKARIELGKSIMKKLCDVMEFEKEDEVREFDLLSLNSAKFSVDTGGFGEVADKIRETSDELLTLMTRFARILEAEGIHHKLPVPPPLLELIEDPEMENEKKIREELQKKLRKNKGKKRKNKKGPSPGMSAGFNEFEFLQPSPSFLFLNKAPSSTDLIQSLPLDVKTPMEYLDEYAERDNLELDYKEVSVSKSFASVHYVYCCRLHTITGEGKGRRRAIAKIDAACQVLKNLVKRQKNNTLPHQMTPLSKEEMELADKLLCQQEDYESLLSDVCLGFNVRPPVYKSLFNDDKNGVRCKALGMNTVGYGKTRNLARRMAAKLILDIIKGSKIKESLTRAF